MLPFHYVNLADLIDQCPDEIKQGFVGALYAVVTRSKSVELVNEDELRSANQALASLADHTREARINENDDPVADLVYFQIATMMAIAHEMGGPDNILQDNRTIAGALWYGIGTTLAFKLYLTQSNTWEYEDNVNVDDFRCIARRTVLVFLVSQRFHNAGLGSTPGLHDPGIILQDHDKHVLGEPLYHLSRKRASASSVCLLHQPIQLIVSRMCTCF